VPAGEHVLTVKGGHRACSERSNYAAGTTILCRGRRTAPTQQQPRHELGKAHFITAMREIAVYSLHQKIWQTRLVRLVFWLALIALFTAIAGFYDLQLQGPPLPPVSSG